MRKKKAVLAALAVTAVLLVPGCGQKTDNVTWTGQENSIYVTKDMAVKSALVYTSDQFNDLYQESELEEFAKSAAADYAAENGGTQNPVTLESCSLDGRTGTLVFSYASPEEFVNFSQATGDDTHTVTSLTVRKVSDELAAGGLTDADTYRTPKDQTVDSGEVLKQSDYVAVAVEGGARIFTEGTIAYVSGSPEEVEIKDSHTAVTTEGKHYIIFK